MMHDQIGGYPEQSADNAGHGRLGENGAQARANLDATEHQGSDQDRRAADNEGSLTSLAGGQQDAAALVVNRLVEAVLRRLDEADRLGETEFIETPSGIVNIRVFRERAGAQPGLVLALVAFAEI